MDKTLNPDLIRASHMLDATIEALSFIKGKKKKDLVSDRLLTLALIKEIEIIGEAASKVTSPFRLKHSEIPWEVIVRTRNRLIHGYFDINLNIVWETVKISLPELKDALEDVLAKY
jgi:uncharacterized protein with HEPN domain